MSTDLLYDQSELLILLAMLGMLLLAAEVGYRIGRRRSESQLEVVRAQVGGIQGALGGLFALLLGFTFAMSLSRFDLRRQLVVREANAIGTAVLRSQVPPARSAELSGLFRRYVEVRVAEGAEANLPTPERLERDAEASRLQDELWKRAAAGAEADPRSIPAGLLLQAMNEVIDVKGERDAALAAHVPESVLMLLFVFAALMSGVMGYANGLAGARYFGTAAILMVVIGLVLFVIVDLDRPGRGLIRVSQESMVGLQRSLEAPK